jgi:hypothetical protein
MKPSMQTSNWSGTGRQAAPISEWPTAGHSKTPMPRMMLATAVRLLLVREMGRDLLAERLRERYPYNRIDVDNIVARLIVQGYVDGDGTDQLLLGLTDAGDTYARSLPPELGSATAAATTRYDGLAPNARDAPQLLTRSPVRGAASAADLRNAPPRPGSDQHEAAPSRIGDRYHYRDGRVTELDGTEIERAHHARHPGRNTVHAL